MFSLIIFLSLSLSLLSFFSFSPSLSVSFSDSFYDYFLNLCLSVCLSVFVPVSDSVCLSVCLNVSMSLHHSVSPSPYLSVFLSFRLTRPTIQPCIFKYISFFHQSTRRSYTSTRTHHHTSLMQAHVAYTNHRVAVFPRICTRTVNPFFGHAHNTYQHTSSGLLPSKMSSPT